MTRVRKQAILDGSNASRLILWLVESIVGCGSLSDRAEMATDLTTSGRSV